MLPLVLFVPGLAASKGSVTSFTSKSGQRVYRPASKYTKPWMDTVKFFALKKCKGFITTKKPVLVFVYFYFERTKGDYGTGRNAGVLKASAPKHYTKKPDVDKLIRAILDALTGIVWADDKQVFAITARKLYCDGKHRIGAYIDIKEAE